MKKPSEISDYFERLEISRDSTSEEIKRAYYQKAQIYHPDKNPEKEKESEIEFIALGEAYEKLTKKELKYSGEKGFNYYNNFFEEIKTAIKLADKMSKSDNEKTKYFGELVKRTLPELF